MYLKSLEISGFKSFGKKADLEFNSNISAIVGPNGSGKSNVAEAFRFVLGEQSIKSMRGKRGEDLIFNGSQTVPRGNRSSVKITFDNSKRFLDIDFDEVVVERHVHRDGTNQYFLNKSSVRLKDISELLSKANIGSSGHHIISQGESDKILNVNSKERKVMIEEALGLKIYQYKRIVSEKKLEKVQKNIEEVQSLRKENTPHLKFLKRQINKIEKTLEMRKESGFLYREYFKREKTYISYWQEKNIKEKKPLIEKLAQLEDRVCEAKKILEDARGEDQRPAGLNSLKFQLNELRKEKDQFTFKLGRAEGIISALENAFVDEIKINNPNEFIKISLKNVRGLELDITSQVELASSLEDISQVKGILNRIKESLTQFIVKYSTVQPVEPLNNAVVENKEKVKELNKEKEETKKQIKEIEEKEVVVLEKYNSLKLEIEKDKDLNKDAELAVLEIMAQQTEYNAKLNSLRNLEEKILLIDENYKNELNESYSLAGRDAVQFKDLELKDSGGEFLDNDKIINEDRQYQADRLKKIERIKVLIEDGGGLSGEDVVNEYEEASKRDEFLNNEVEDLEKTAQSLEKLIDELKEKLEGEFRNGLEKINYQFKEFFILMFGGGKANLNLVKEKTSKRKKDDFNVSEEDLVNEVESEEFENNELGIEVDVILPNKKTKGLQMLSGGERSLTSIALLFAMSQVSPPPFIILDETDAALDEANSKKYGDMIEKLSSHSQLILITHNRETMSRADILYGVTMSIDGISKLLSVQFSEAVKVAK
ncbi:MAG: AAA family ATPase [Candidatus Pacebacteria bacterium]|nr:AAA family ATPase [Candidatus Paceibacterota bacterium]